MTSVWTHFMQAFFSLFILNGSQITRNQSQNIRYDCARAIVYVIRRLERQKIKYEWINVWLKKKKLWQLTERESEHATNAPGLFQHTTLFFAVYTAKFALFCSHFSRSIHKLSTRKYWYDDSTIKTTFRK